MKKNAQMSKWRFLLVASLLAMLPLALVWHLARLQVLPGEEKGFQFLQEAGEARTLRTRELDAYRGAIMDRNGELLAVSTPVVSVYADPQELKAEELKRLAPLVNLKLAELGNRLKKYAGKRFVYLARHLPPHEAEKIKREKFAGLGFETEYRRFYPAGEVAAHILGFTDIDDRGQEGVELAYDSWLAGKPGFKQFVMDLKGNVVKQVGKEQVPISGKDIYLSVDLRLQYLAYRELKAAVAKQGAKSGSVVLIDVESAEILAMANQPSYNPNDRSNIRADQTRNRAITDVFEPGSTAKPFTIVAALESGKYYPGSVIDTHPGHVRVGRKTFLDPVNYGQMDLEKIIKKSSQVGITKIALNIDPLDLRDTFFRVGFGQSTEMGFPGESTGVLPNRKRWHPIERATFAFGHGLSVNTVQLAQAYNVFATGGLFRRVSLLHDEALSSTENRVVGKKVAKQVLKMLKTVAEQGGTATRAQIKAYPVAGKTGTAHKVTKHGYADDKYMALFAGFAPADRPALVAVVVINEPTDGEYFGGEAAAPVFANIVEGALRMMHVPPESGSLMTAGAPL